MQDDVPFVAPETVIGAFTLENVVPVDDYSAYLDIVYSESGEKAVVVYPYPPELDAFFENWQPTPGAVYQFKEGLLTRVEL